jgi:hypothetical protein
VKIFGTGRCVITFSDGFVSKEPLARRPAGPTDPPLRMITKLRLLRICNELEHPRIWEASGFAQKIEPSKAEWHPTDKGRWVTSQLRGCAGRGA